MSISCTHNSIVNVKYALIELPLHNFCISFFYVHLLVPICSKDKKKLEELATGSVYHVSTFVTTDMTVWFDRTVIDSGGTSLHERMEMLAISTRGKIKDFCYHLGCQNQKGFWVIVKKIVYNIMGIVWW